AERRGARPGVSEVRREAETAWRVTAAGALGNGVGGARGDGCLAVGSHGDGCLAVREALLFRILLGRALGDAGGRARDFVVAQGEVGEDVEFADGERGVAAVRCPAK